MDIYEKESMPKETYESKIAKIAELVSTHEDAESVLKTFSHLSVLDRYRHGNREVMFSVMRDVDGKIKKSSLHLEKRFRQACVDLLERISTIENLNRLDADLVCFLCKSCKVDSLKSLLGEIGRSVWPYVKRPLWTSEVFVDIVVDIFETIGKQLSELHPTNFMMAWDVIRRNFILSSSKLSSYSKLRLLSLIEFYRSGWRRSKEQTRWYRTQYDNEFIDPMKKEVMTFLGLLSSKRKTSLSVKPGRSAADFIKRRQSSQTQLVPDQTSTLTTLDEPVKESSEDVFEETEDKNHLCVDVQQELLTKNRFKENLSGKSHVAKASPEEIHFMEKSTEVNNNKFDESGNTETDKFDKYKEDVEVQKIKSQDRGGISSKEDEKTAAKSEGTLEGKEDDKEEKDDVFKANDSTWQRDTNNLLEGENVRDREEDIENLVLSPSSSCEGFGTWKNDHNNNHKRFFDRKKEIVKVPTKFAGRVIGAHGSVVLSIQEETGARVSTLSKQREKENEENMQDESSEECRFEIVGNDESVAKAKAKNVHH
ncbi:uncharacterized protein LOC124436693 isoform X2 [Xenia sp. Carnegie-2017]|uniref:uncharacterized protein LOC124436693 isoform X2 n=1 Tax=Xenia sp. Carnegie-2017 TaxID=2897299 RepID=UPI001F035DE9|nr:uncharacterized protein LOC124436693 isoform X2 [Xenia sp. Carnegie-2017]